MYRLCIFDLDGTLTDPKTGICTCVQYALSAFGIEEPELDKLEPFIGPPLKDSFMRFYGFTVEQAEAAVEMAVEMAVLLYTFDHPSTANSSLAQ